MVILIQFAGDINLCGTGKMSVVGRDSEKPSKPRKAMSKLKDEIEKGKM